MTEDPVPNHLRSALADVVERLAAKDYAGLKRDGIDPFPDADLSLWIREYGANGATIVPLPSEAWASASAIDCGGEPQTWAVVLNLWTEEEGMSDLSMEAEVTEGADGVRVIIEGIHVM